MYLIIGCFHEGSNGELAAVKCDGGKVFSMSVIILLSSWTVVQSYVKSYTHCATGCIDSECFKMCVYVL